MFTTPKSNVDDEDTDEIRSQKPKRRRIIVDSDSDQENESDNKPVSTTAVDKAEVPSTSKVVMAPTSPNPAGGALEQKLKALSKKKSADIDVDHDEVATLDDEPQQWLHTKLEFLRAHTIKDANNRRPGHPEYDPTTLHVPKNYLESLTPVKT